MSEKGNYMQGSTKKSTKYIARKKACKRKHLWQVKVLSSKVFPPKSNMKSVLQTLLKAKTNEKLAKWSDVTKSEGIKSAAAQ